MSFSGFGLRCSAKKLYALLVLLYARFYDEKMFYAQKIIVEGELDFELYAI